jgi:hypothetical protein
MKQVAEELAEIIRKTSGKQVRVTGKPSIEILEKGLWRKAIDIDPASWARDIPTTRVEGIRVQTPKSQLDRLLVRMEEEFGGKGYSRFYRFAKTIGGEPDIGIGAKPPTLQQLTKLTNQGIYNTIRDIFVRGLSKETRLKALEEVAPDLKPEAQQMLKMERELDRLTRLARARVTATARAPAIARTVFEARQKLIRTQARYQLEVRALEQKLRARALILEEVARELPPRYSRESERLYRELLRGTAYTRAEDRITRTERVEAPARAERVSRTERIEEPRTERITRPERQRAERLQRVARVERLERGRISRPPRPPRPPPRIPPLRAPPIRLKTPLAEAARAREFAGAITWRQGMLGRKNKRPVYIAIKAPYAGPEDVQYFLGQPPPNTQPVKGGAKEAYRSVQTITGKPPERLFVDMGIYDVLLKAPGKTPGRPGAIQFRRDVGQQVRGDITIGRDQPRVIHEEPVVETVAAAPLLKPVLSKETAKAIGAYSVDVKNGIPRLKLRRRV